MHFHITEPCKVESEYLRIGGRVTGEPCPESGEEGGEAAAWRQLSFQSWLLSELRNKGNLAKVERLGNWVV